MHYFEGPSSPVSRIDDHMAGHYRRVLAAVLAVFLLAGGLVGLLARTASASTSPITLTMTSGTFGAHGNTPTALPTPATFSGHLNSSTGAITAGTLTTTAIPEHNTGSTETVHIFDVHSGTATGTIDYHGNVTINDTVTIQVKITSPISETCNATPVHLILQSTSPYNTTTKDVDLSDTTFSIPNFTTCGLARTSLDSRFSGSTGNVLTFNLHGTLTEPPPPAVTSTTSLSASPASPQLQGTSVGLSATVKKTTGATATTATGTIDFYTGATLLSAQPVSSGTASYTTTALPSGTDGLKAVYSGNSTYNGSTSSTTNYVIQPKPTVTVSTTTLSATRGSGSPTTFSITITNPATGKSWTHLWLQLRTNNISGLRPSQVTLSYENPAHTWCPITLSGVKKLTGTFKGTSGACSSATSFALAAGHSLVVPFEVSYTAAANTGTQTFAVALLTVSGSTVVTPFTAATVTTVPTHAPYAKGHSPKPLPTITINPTTKFTVTLGATPLSSAPKGYVVPVHPTINHPATTTTTTIYYPNPSGTVTFIVDGTTVLTTPAGSLAFTEAAVATATLSLGSHTLQVKYDGSSIYNGAHVTKTFSVTTAAPGTAFVCRSATHPTITASVVASGTLPATSYTGKATATSVSVTLHTDPNTGPTTTNAISTVSILLTPGGGTTASSLTPTTSAGVTTVSWSGLTIGTIPITGTVGTEVSVGVETINFVQDGLSYTCGAKTTATHLGTVKVVAPPTPVTWSLAGCTSGSTTAPAWANTEKIVAKGAGGGGGGAAASATGYGGAGGAGGSVTTTFTISGSSTVSAKTGCAGKGAPQGSGVVGNGGAAVSGWSSSGKGGQGRYTAIFASGNDGTGGSGGGSTGVCNGAGTCTSATTAHVVAVASGGGGGGESMCSGTNAGSGGQAGNAGTTATSSSKGKGLSGTAGATGGTGGVAGGAGGANNKSTGSGSATGSAGGQGKKPVAGDGGGSGGGGAGYIGGAGGAPTAFDCGAGGGGGGGASWVATAGGSTTFGTGSGGGTRHGTTGTAGSVTVTFSFTKTR